MADPDIFSSFTDRAYYSAHFMDVGFWEPFVRQVCRSHGFSPRNVTKGLPGTYPTFITELDDVALHQPAGHVVVKFFGPPFEGAEAFRVERALGDWLIGRSLPIRSPIILAAGELIPQWQYLIFEHISGMSIGQLRHRLAREDWLSVAHQLGLYLRQLHSLAVPHIPEIATRIQPAWDGFAGFLDQQRRSCPANHEAWKDLPLPLLSQLEEFVLPVGQLIDFSAPPCLVHADITADHLLGHLVDGRWQTLAVIDWGDAITGNLLYELPALYIDLFAYDSLLLGCFLEAYGLPDFYRQDFARKAFSMMLLHPYPLPDRLYSPYQDSRTLQDLANQLFTV